MVPFILGKEQKRPRDHDFEKRYTCGEHHNMEARQNLLASKRIHKEPPRQLLIIGRGNGNGYDFQAVPLNPVAPVQLDAHHPRDSHQQHRLQTMTNLRCLGDAVQTLAVNRREGAVACSRCRARLLHDDQTPNNTIDPDINRARASKAFLSVNSGLLDPGVGRRTVEVGARPYHLETPVMTQRLSS